MSNEFRSANLPAWKEMISNLFAGSTPKVVQWEELEMIARVLNTIGYNNSGVSNHIFLPPSGGLDLMEASLGEEQGCIEIKHDAGPMIVKPNVLTFRSFGNSGDWDYFHLDFKLLEPSGIYTYEENENEDPFVTEVRTTYEPLTRFPGGTYEDISIANRGFTHNEYGDEIPLPEGTQSITRYMRGSVVIFAKSSIYNLFLKDTYDGRHAKMDEEQFAQYIERLSTASV
ncbi:hypothetical protein [Bacillus cereus]|uniref:Uncharacterized protein n=2 Tax=Bacillus cereus group TaxID=86661 RepID=A0A2B1KEV9_BACCE|nr:hypothetical protein [Bacillus cereus]PFN23390.1 hypothetical protein COJ50_17315 [Bacillus cereus]